MAFTSTKCRSGLDKSFEEFSKEELIIFIQKIWDHKLFSVFDPPQSIRLLRVQACGITFQHETSFLSGESIAQEIYIPTEDLRIDKEGRIIYTQAVVSNCASEKGKEILIKDENILVRDLPKSEHYKLNVALQHLNDFCTGNDN